MISENAVVNNNNGLHIKPAGALSSIALKYDCSTYLKVRTYRVNAKSVLGILSAKVKQGEEVEILCDGNDEDTCLNEIIEAINNKFGME